MTNGKVGCALVGFGYWGPNLARNVQSHADAELLYVCDLDPAELDRVRQLHPRVATTQSYDEILSDPAVDAVLIATPPPSHAALGRAAIAAGKHLFVEKPLATALSDALELAAAAYRSGLTLMVGHTFLYSPAIRKIRQLIDLGEIGEIVHVSSSVDPGHPKRVVAAGSSHMVPGVEDTVNAYLEYDGGPTVEVRASWIYPLKVRDLTIIGTRKMIVFDDTQPIDKIRVVDRRLEVAQPSTSLGEFHMSYRYGDTFMPLLENTEPLATEIADTGVRVVEALEKVQSSLRQTGAPTVAEFSSVR